MEYYTKEEIDIKIKIITDSIQEYNILIKEAIVAINDANKEATKLFIEDKANISKLGDLFTKLSNSTSDGMKSISDSLNLLKNRLDKLDLK